MRNFVFIIAALAAIVSVGCSGDETLEAPEKKAISFENAFVDKRTRTTASDPSTTTNDISSFTVYGYQGTKILFNGTSVSKGTDNAWTYSPLKYWVAGETYNFVALADVTNPTVSINESSHAITTEISSFTNDGETDPLVSSQVEKTGVQTDAVEFTFKHLLAKVKFTFENGFSSNDDVTLQVKEVKITDAYETGKVKVVGGTTGPTITWSDQATSTSDNGFTLDFGDTGEIAPPASGSTDKNKDEAANAKLLIPSGTDKKYTITFKIDVIANATSTTDKLVTKTYEKSVEVSGQALDAGKSYNFLANLDASNIGDTELKPIKFAINEVSDWGTATSVTVPTPTTK
jgi:hypothetical protein